jgi:hypothetical protein
MSPKRPASSKASGSETKRKRRMLTIVEKVKLLDMLKEGKNFANVARHYGLNESTVRYIFKEEKNIRETAAVSFSKTAKRAVTPRSKPIVKMESTLAMWINDCRKKNISMDTNTICTKAKKLYETFAAKGDGDEEAGPSSDSPTKAAPFNASRGWFEKFRKRYGLRSVSLHGEAASADKEAAEAYVDTFKTIIEEGGYMPEQVFNMDETGLFWKRMPSRTFIMKDEATASGFKAQKDRVTLILCGNTAGHMIKPALIYKAKNPRALKNKDKNELPVYWMHHPKAWITKLLTSDWFHHCFIPETKLYLAKKSLPFKVLLIMDNAGGHAIDLSYDGVQIEFLPPNTTSLIQPMDQSVIRAFKALYTRYALQNLVEAMDSDFSLKAYWPKYTIATCLQNIQRAIKEMKSETVNASWKKLWPETVHDCKGFTPEEIHNSAVNEALKLAKILGGDGFDDMTPDDVNDLIDAHSQPLTDEDLEEMTKSASEEEEEEQGKRGVEEEEGVGLTLDRLATMMRTAKELEQMAQSWDPIMVRSLQFSNNLESTMSAYKNIFTQKKKQRQQLPITMFLTRTKTPNKSTPSSVTDEGEDPPPPVEVLDEEAPSEEL